MDGNMNNFIGGLFKRKEDAERARKALHENGVDKGSIKMLDPVGEFRSEG